MAKNGTEFSKYAQAFREVIDGNKTDIDILTKELLKMGLTVNDKNYINEEYPEYIDDNKERHIAGNKGDTLRKYFGGTNDLSRLIPKLETEFDSDFHERYCEELQDYDDARIMAFAQVLNIDVSEDDIDIVSEAIAEYYSSIVIGSAIKKSRKGKKDKDEPESDRHKILLSYTLEESEKNAIIKLASCVKNSLRALKSQEGRICRLQRELTAPTPSVDNSTSEDSSPSKDNSPSVDNSPSENSGPSKGYRVYLNAALKSAINNYGHGFNDLKELCTNLIVLLTPKKALSHCFDETLSIAKEISSEEYIIAYPDETEYSCFCSKLSKLGKCIDRLLHTINKL